MPKPEDMPKSSKPRKKESNRFASRVPFDRMQFVRIELSESDKRAFKEYLAQDESYTLDVDTCLRLGYEFSVKLDSDGVGVLASLRSPFTDGENSGYVLTGRGGSATRAIQVLAFKLDYLIAGRSWEEASNSRRSDYDDIG